MQRIAQQVQERSPETPVVCAYLELTEPDLPSACAQLLAQHPRVTVLRVLPVFLGVGKHAREDLPVLMSALRSQHPQVRFEQLAAVGENPKVLACIAEQALA